MADDPKLLTIHQVCDRLHVSRRTVYNWLVLGKLKITYRTPGGAPRFTEDQLNSCQRDSK